MTSLSRIGAAGILVLLAAASACRKPPPAPEKEPLPAAIAPSVAPSTTASAAPPVAGPPTLVAEKYAEVPGVTYAVEGAIIVVDDNKRVGRVVEGGVEWTKAKLPPPNEAVGGPIVTGVRGVWPDALDLLYTSANGRALMPSYAPLTGKGGSVTAAPGGGLGDILGVARVGATTIVALWDAYEGVRLVSVRGPALARKGLLARTAGCKEDTWRGPDPFAVIPVAIEGTKEGSLVSIGEKCDTEKPVAEIWDPKGKSRIVPLDAWLKSAGGDLLRGKGDELFLHHHSFGRILRYDHGTFEPLPRLERPTRRAWVTKAGNLYVSDRRAIHRLEGGAWTLVGLLPETPKVHPIAIEDDEMWGASDKTIYRLKPGPRAEKDEPCGAHFVYLYDASPKNDDKFTYPTTRKALASFAGAAQIGLVEIKDEGRKRLGVTVPSREVGEAVVRHVKETMKDEDPQLFCFAPAPGASRSIPIGDK